LHWQHQKRRDMKTGHLFIHSQHLDPWHGRRCVFLLGCVVPRQQCARRVVSVNRSVGSCR